MNLKQMSALLYGGMLQGQLFGHLFPMEHLNPFSNNGGIAGNPARPPMTDTINT